MVLKPRKELANCEFEICILQFAISAALGYEATQGGGGGRGGEEASATHNSTGDQAARNEIARRRKTNPARSGQGDGFQVHRARLCADQHQSGFLVEPIQVLNPLERGDGFISVTRIVALRFGDAVDLIDVLRWD